MMVIHRSCLTTAGSTMAQQDMITQSATHRALEPGEISRWQTFDSAPRATILPRPGTRHLGARRLARFELIQPMYNLVRRQAEVEILPLAAAEKLGVITYSPLGGGLLTGKYGTSERPEGGRLVDDPRYVNRYGLETDFATADRFTEFAQKLDVKPATLAVAWTMSHPDVTAAIIGARNLTQLEDSLAALDLEMTSDMREQISALSPAPPPATDHTETLKPNWA
jgi:aryl-alcohol dehydrogenase-like predicted oxidoreductase